MRRFHARQALAKLSPPLYTGTITDTLSSVDEWFNFFALVRQMDIFTLIHDNLGEWTPPNGAKTRRK